MARRAAILVLLLVGACRDEASAPPAPPDAAPDAVARAAAWLAAFPADQLRFDAAIGLAAVRARRDTPALRRAFEAARAVADRDVDHPLRRLYDPAAPGRPPSWDVPAGGERVNVNRPVAEALHCREHGLRPETLAYVTGPMRDGGGYHTTHAVWTLVIARDQGCLEPARFAALARPLLDELRAAQPPAPPADALGVDLFAERLLMLALAGERGPDLDRWADALGAAQRPDGGFGELAPDEDPYHRHHATVMALWALTALSR